jgi:tRNA pseudouridine55 synthase
VLLVDKPAGPTSHDVVARVRRALKTRAVGHAGTLDPFATGLLVVLVGKATRLARFAEQQPKTYLATARLGFATTTDDATGERIASVDRPTRRTEDEVRAALAGFAGHSLQRPSTYSAKKVDGERSYARARRGEPVELAAVPITVHAIELLRLEDPEVEFRVTVSPGTYIRALARDLGERLGTGAHLSALRREAIGAMRVTEAVSLDQLGPDDVQPSRRAVEHLPSLVVSMAEARALGFGKAIPAQAAANDPVAALTDDGQVVAIGRVVHEAFVPNVVLEAAG